MSRAASRSNSVAAFHASMPQRYRDLFHGTAVSEHAAIAERRAGATAHVELWRRLPNGGAVLCVVAGDRPGLLSFISAALVGHSMEVVSAQAYTRAARNGAEAVDLFWLRYDAAHRAPVLEVDAARIGVVVRALIAGESTIDEVVRRGGVRPPPPPGAATTVTFTQSEGARASTLTVETFDRPGLLLAITQALTRARVQIIALEATTTDDAGVVDRFTVVELDGTPLRPHRYGLLQIEVLDAVDFVAHGERGGAAFVRLPPPTESRRAHRRSG